MFTPLNQLSQSMPAAHSTPSQPPLAALCQLQLPPDDGEYQSVSHLLDTDFPLPEEILCGLYRGEVAALVADDARAKTTWLLNLAVALAGGQAAPFVPAAQRFRGVVYLSGDAAPCRIKQQLAAMLPHTENPEIVAQNIVPMLKYRVNGDRLDLTNENHWQALTARFLDILPAVIIVDGVKIGAAASKSQKAAKQQVMQQWKELAEEYHCVVIVTQTTGKANRLRQTAIANWLENADTVYQLSSDQRHGSDYRLLSCEQSQWDAPEAVHLRLAEAEQRYHLIAPEEAAALAAKTDAPTIEELVEYLGQGWQEAATITQHFEGRANLQQVAKLIKEAHWYGWIMRQGRNEPWQLAQRGNLYLAERKAQEAAAAEAAKKNGSDTNSDGAGETDSKNGSVVAARYENGTDAEAIAGYRGDNIEKMAAITFPEPMKQRKMAAM